MLRGVDLHVTAGSMTALIGESGSGKTTLARLIARFFDVDQGSVLVGGVDVRQMSSAVLARQISQIFQDSYLSRAASARTSASASPVPVMPKCWRPRARPA